MTIEEMNCCQEKVESYDCTALYNFDESLLDPECSSTLLNIIHGDEQFIADDQDNCWWKYSYPNLWNNRNVKDWILETARTLDFTFFETSLDSFSGILGRDLMEMSEEDFELKDCINGTFLFQEFQSLKSNVGNEWTCLEPNLWSNKNVTDWILDTGRRLDLNLLNINLYNFSGISGKDLMQMSKEDFVMKDHVNGKSLFKEFQNLKSSEFQSLKSSDGNEWARLEPNLWSNKNVTDWILDTGRRLNRNLFSFNLNTFSGILGKDLMQMSEEDFVAKDYINGKSLFKEFQNLKSSVEVMNSSTTVLDPALDSILTTSTIETTDLQSTYTSTLSADDLFIQQQNVMHLETQSQNGLVLDSSQLTGYRFQPIAPRKQLQDSTTNYITSPSYNKNIYPTKARRGRPANPLSKITIPKVKRQRGRPPSLNSKSKRRNKSKSSEKLWKFIRDLLQNPQYNPSMIKWEDPSDGVFRIVDSSAMAALWGLKKHNSKMNYEKMSRALRTYYRKRVIIPAPKNRGYPKKLVYKFGENCLWQIRNITVEETSRNSIPSFNESFIP